MAKKGPVTSTWNKPLPVGRKLQLVAIETLEAIYKNFKTQGIFPEGEVYPGFFQENARARAGQWKSTGAGFDSFHWQINDAAAASDVGVREARIDFFFAYYLKFVDMGVGKGRPIRSVNRAADADRNIRYMESWNPSEGSTQRPAIMMEFRHQTKRLQRYFANVYKYEAQRVLVDGIEGTYEIEMGVTMYQNL